jgi:hypothetical protein
LCGEADNISRINVNGWDENACVDLLMTPSSFFDMFGENLTSDILQAVRKLAPNSGVTGLNPDYFDQDTTIDRVVSGLKCMAAVMKRPVQTSTMDRQYLAENPTGEIGSHYSPNASARLKTDPSQLVPVGNQTQGTPYFEIEFDFASPFFDGTLANKAFIRTLFTSLSPPPPPPPPPPPMLPGLTSFANLIQNITAVTSGWLRLLRIDCTGSVPMATVVWGQSYPGPTPGANREWSSTLTTAHDFGLLFSIVLAYAGLYDDTIAILLEGAPVWSSQDATQFTVQTCMNQLYPMISGTGALFEVFCAPSTRKPR